MHTPPDREQSALEHYDRQFSAPIVDLGVVTASMPPIPDRTEDRTAAMSVHRSAPARGMRRLPPHSVDLQALASPKPGFISKRRCPIAVPDRATAGCSGRRHL